MAIKHQLLTINQYIPTLVSIPLNQEIDYEKNVALSVQNLDPSITIYIGAQNVTTTSYGFALSPGSTLSIDLLLSDTLYAVSASGAPYVGILAAEA